MEYKRHPLVGGAILHRLEISLPRFASLFLSVSALDSYPIVTA